MDFIRFAIDNPVKTTVGVILILLFGIIALARIPVQLTPDVDRPVITIRTNWSGRSPEEIEKSILLEQEEKLKSVHGLWKMTSGAQLGRATITLEFNVGAPPERILQEVSNKIDEVPEYPEDVDRPIIDMADTAGDNAIAYLLLQADDPEFEVATFYDYADRYLKPSLERIEGVAEIDIKGGREHQVQVRFDPEALARRSITISELHSALRLDNVNASAGDLVNSRQDVRFRVLGQYDSLQPLRGTIIKYDVSGSPIRVSDVASVELALEKMTHFDQCKGRTSMTIFVKRKTGSNVLDIIKEVHRVVDEMNAEGGVLKSFKNDRYGLRLRMAFDDSHYIYSDGSVTVVPMGQIADFVSTEASQEIRRVEQQRAIAITVTPPKDVALEDAQATILDVVEQARAEGKMGNDIFVSLSGNADRLSQVRASLLGDWTGWNWNSLASVVLSRFFLALVITYLLMAALFENFRHPLVIMFTVPMATVGGFIGLWIVHRQDPTQQLDVLTMLGFVILVGVVVNNAILIVHQALNFMRGHKSQDPNDEDVEPMEAREAIYESVKTRMRPIFMTTCTSVFGMLPLVIAPGSGSELYRGLGSVVVGGLAFATVFTLVVIPLLFSLVLDMLFLFHRKATADPQVAEAE